MIIDVLFIKVDAFDSAGLINDLKKSNKNYLFINFNPKKGIYVGKNNINFKSDNFISKMILSNINARLYYLFYPIIFFIDYFNFFFSLKRYLKNFTEIKNVYCDNTFFAFFISILKKRFFIRNFIYASHDWLPYDKSKKFWSLFGKNIFLIFDYFNSKSCNYIFNHTHYVSDLRNKKWKNKFIDKSIIFYPQLFFNSKMKNFDKVKNQICFLGHVKDFRGLTLIIDYCFKKKIKLVIAGMKNNITSKLEDYCLLKNFKDTLKVTGYLSRVDMLKTVQSSFLGVNLTFTESYTDIVLPSKLFDYIQNYTPSLVSSTQLYSSNLINKFNLGEVIENDNLDEVSSKIEKIILNYESYINNIKKFQKDYRETNIFNYLV